jgi:Coenzyme PQQ synthesis protein D (PqqD)
VRQSRVVFARSGESALLLDPASGNYFSLTDVGARIWELCDGQHTLDEIADALAGEYDAARETIHADAHALLDELAAEGLLERT